MSTASAATDETNKPFYLRGNYAPVAEEVEAFDLPVHGAIPPELNGHLLRNGPNPRNGTPEHWFFGDGMLHAVEFGGGRALSYRNRWIRTRPFLEKDVDLIDMSTGVADRTVAVANTHVVGHAGRVLALVESSFPTEVTCELETVGIYDFEGKLNTAMTAHPKICPDSGEMHFFGYGFMAPYLVYHCADAQGRLIKSEEITVPGPTMIHDFAMTESNIVFMDLPVVFDLEQAMRGAMPYRWSDDYGARLGVMPRGGTNSDVRWYEIEPCYVFHPLNAYDDGDDVVIDVVRYPELWRNGSGSFDSASLHRWRIDRSRAVVSEQALDDREIEFPRINEHLTGSKHRYGYATWNPDNVSGVSTAIVKYDLESGASQVHDFGPGRSPSEAVFVSASEKAAEDEGWLLTVVYDAADHASEAVLLDATDITARPVARVALPQRVPFGFHGNWIGR